MRIAADVRIRRRHALRRIDHQQRHIRRLQMLAAHNDAQLLRHQLRLALAPNPRRVDEPEVVPIALHHLVDSIARRSRNRRHNRTVRSRQRIQQRALAHIRSADDRNLRLALHMLAVAAQSPHRRFRTGGTRIFISDEVALILLGLFLDSLHVLRRLFRHRLRRQRRPHLIQQVCHANPMLRRDRNQVPEPQRAKVLRAPPPAPPNPSCSPPETAASSPAFRISSRASSTSGAASSVRPSTTITIASASSSATRACLKISAGISASSSGTTPPVSTMRTSRPAHSVSP